ncbi:hypothetical protein MINTMi198_17910 [Mycobacterium intracellulare M.i.198]|uniref:hypothetical protein n=1 Tax=Mycobacterium intracellulare TaxID=1767 RepID=UPI0002DA9C93|nr:hypothetical protein [Mycobacterium intracellulare]BCP36421.1 hypothetical protein MINTMi198_17910 [Mycobacterium intracellulare M.i.198]
MKLIDKSVDRMMAELFRFLLWLGMEVLGVLRIPDKDRPETQETLAKLVSRVDELEAENSDLADLAAELASRKHATERSTGPNRPNNNRKLTEREVSEIREHSRMGWKNADLARAFDVNPATISRIVRGQYHRKLGAA